MSTERLTTKPAIVPRVLSNQLWGPRDLFVIDVGASGGIGWYWEPFKDRIRAVGFEPLVAEAERLQQLAHGSKIRYEAAFVTGRDYDALFPPELRSDRLASKINDPFQRVSALRAHELLKLNYVEQVFNAGAPVQYADRRIVLDEYVPAAEHESVDFIKIDTDGHDFPVLLGTEALLQAGGALGFSIEAQFHGASHEYANTFANIDRFMRARGFSLFDLDAYHYSRAALPAPFVYDIPAQTLSGQVMWGEAVYFRDLALADYERMWPYEITRERVIKLACLYDVFGLPDCAAELLITHRQLVGKATGALLDDLARAQGKPRIPYDEFMHRFETDPEHLYPSRRRAAAAPVDAAPGPPVPPPPPPAPPPEPAPVQAIPPAIPEPQVAPPPIDDGSLRADTEREMRALRKRIERQEKKIAELQERVRRRNARIDQLMAAPEIATKTK
jgi:hypothetical protein